MSYFFALLYLPIFSQRIIVKNKNLCVATKNFNFLIFDADLNFYINIYDFKLLFELQ